MQPIGQRVRDHDRRGRAAHVVDDAQRHGNGVLERDGPRGRRLLDGLHRVHHRAVVGLQNERAAFCTGILDRDAHEPGQQPIEFDFGGNRLRCLADAEQVEARPLGRRAARTARLYRRQPGAERAGRIHQRRITRRTTRRQHVVLSQHRRDLGTGPPARKGGTA